MTLRVGEMGAIRRGLYTDGSPHQSSLLNLKIDEFFTALKASEDGLALAEQLTKDLHLAALTAYEHQQPLYLANLAKELYGRAVQDGMGRADFAAVHRTLAEG